MLTEVANLLENIKNDYSWFLYSYDFQKCEYSGYRNIKYPSCCLLSAQLISSFLYVHFSKDTKCIYDIILNGRGYGHAWSIFNAEIIDFTIFQFDDFSKPLKGDTKISRQEFERIMDQVSIFYTKESHSYSRFEGSEIDDFQEQSLLAVGYAQKYPPTKDGFMEYLLEAIQIEGQISYK